MLGALAGDRRCLIAAPRQHVERDAADAAGGAAHHHLARLRPQVVQFHQVDRQRGGVAGHADGGRIEQAQPRGQGQDPVARDARVLGVAAVGVHAYAEAVHHHLVALAKARVARGDDRSGEVDAADARIGADDLALPGGRERVLVIDARIGDAQSDFTGRELVDTHFDHAALHLALVLEQPVCLKACHGRSPFLNMRRASVARCSSLAPS